MAVYTERCYDFRKRRKKKSEYAVLVDRVWPRGLSRDSLKHDEWLRDVAPSTELRKWFAHDPDKWPQFKKAYQRELAEHRDELEHLRAVADKRDLVLLYSARDTEHNQAVALAEFLNKSGARPASR